MATAQKSMGDMAGRVLLTLIGATGIIVGAFMHWIHDLGGMQLSNQALYKHVFTAEVHPATTVGMIVLIIGLAAVVGLATSGWLTRLAGALAIVVFTLLWIQLYLKGARFLPGPGPWLALAGGIVAAVGGG
jgi:hypothetical protein